MGEEGDKEDDEENEEGDDDKEDDEEEEDDDDDDDEDDDRKLSTTQRLKEYAKSHNLLYPALAFFGTLIITISITMLCLRCREHNVIKFQHHDAEDVRMSSY